MEDILLEPYEWNEDFRHQLMDTSYNELLDRCRNSVKKFCKDWKGDDHFYTEYQTKNPEELAALEVFYEELIDQLHSMRFNEIKVQYCLFENLTPEGMCELYKSINRTGQPLTEQEILAATTANITFSVSDNIPMFSECLQFVKTYYDDAENAEYLSLEESNSNDSLNLFEMLTGVQQVLVQRYPHVMPQAKKNRQLDTIFKVFKILNGEFDDGAKTALPLFIPKCIDACDIISKMHGEFRFLGPKKALALSHQQMIVLMVALMKDASPEKVCCTQKHIRTCLFYVLLNKCAREKKAKKVIGQDQIDEFDSWNPFRQKNRSGTFDARIGQQICRHEDGIVGVLPLPNKEQFKRLIKAILESDPTYECTKKPKSRNDKYGQFQTLMLSIYFKKWMPPQLALEDKLSQCDHIIPWSSNSWDGQLNLNRLGNMMHIPADVNNAKSNHALVHQFIEKHNLDKYLYPSEDEYKAIVPPERTNTINVEAYNKMCERREAEITSFVLSAML